MRFTHRLAAFTGAGLLAAGLAVGVAPVAAADPHERRGGCEVDLKELDRYHGDKLKVSISDGEKNAKARVEADFKGWKVEDPRARTVWLSHRGEGSTTFEIPKNAKSVEVIVKIPDNDKHGKVDTCHATLKNLKDKH